jgi:hypothetical protein
MNTFYANQNNINTIPSNVTYLYFDDSFDQPLSIETIPYTVTHLTFGKNFNNLVLSEGTFSWWIGYMSNAENIICNKRNYLWHGDIFLDRWKKLQWDYDESVIYDSRKLKEYKIKKIT